MFRNYNILYSFHSAWHLLCSFTFSVRFKTAVSPAAILDDFRNTRVLNASSVEERCRLQAQDSSSVPLATAFDTMFTSSISDDDPSPYG